jgi:hypothetical protein
MTWKRFARVLVRKSERALKSARRDLTDEDCVYFALMRLPWG